ncbi:toll/interleukin-1 receptor domain-containing protein [Acinetobacter baumannii]|uniref:toll/interleukin-1 receptor domain-containing protein n=1 Tax=Acinetobacter baumannii TaxID=470 RepID=UPI003F61CA7A
MTPPKVFISYAHADKKLADDVLEFSNYLRFRGIDAEIDQYEEAPPQGWPLWMASQIDQADFVLILATKTYYERSKDFIKDPKSGLGSKWETLHILQKVYENAFNNTKYIPIFFGHENSEYILDSLKPYTHYDINNANLKEKLVKRLLGQSASIRPELGQQPNNIEDNLPLQPRSRKNLFITNLINLELWDKAHWCGVAFSFGYDENKEEFAIIGLGFRKPKIGKQIFDELNKNLGNNDIKNHIRLTIIRDIDPLNPFHYKMLIGPNEEYLNEMSDRIKSQEPSIDLSDESTVFMGINRVLELHPKNGDNVKKFIEVFNEKKFFYLTNMKEKLDLNTNPSLYLMWFR